jgi:superfamily I DNA and/or RNA helicase
LLLIDEASQVQPVDALGAVARARQIVVVGDSKQLPPTRFFSRMLDEDAAQNDEEADLSAGDVESILGLCCAQNVPQRMLSWHYRSRHHSLIAVSNHEFYDNRLHVIPSPGQPDIGQGLVFHFVEQGLFDRGGSATNRVEARCVAEAVMAHAHRRRKSPASSVFRLAARCDSDELELLRRSDPSAEQFSLLRLRAFLREELEYIQGDERDVILISVGHGKDAAGYMAMNFGPLSNDGGERRLNVLITRARDCCRVFLPSGMISTTAPARCTLPRRLNTLNGLRQWNRSWQEYDSEFERQVAKALASHGYRTDPQVGVADSSLTWRLSIHRNPAATY